MENKFRTLYDGIQSEGISFTEPSLTKQQFKDESDINLILKKFEKTGLIGYLNENPVSYADVSELGSYQDALSIVMAAQELFNNLPSAVRDRFANDPSKFVEFAENPANGQAMIDMGLATLVQSEPKTNESGV